jgi:hypothetical protein
MASMAIATIVSAKKRSLSFSTTNSKIANIIEEKISNLK